MNPQQPSGKVISESKEKGGQKPKILYVDDDPLVVVTFQDNMPADKWDIVCLQNPIEALDQLETIKPWVIISDQKMAQMKGIQFLNMARKMMPQCIRMMLTAQFDQELALQSIREAQIFDYFIKPVDYEAVELGIERAVETYLLRGSNEELVSSLRLKTQELEKKNYELLEKTVQLEQMRVLESDLRSELETWVNPFILWSIKEKVKFPVEKDVVGLCFDICNSSKIHGVFIEGASLRKIILHHFTEAVLQNEGWRETHQGDSAYGHFGVFNPTQNPYEAALAAARQFRVMLRNVSKTSNVPVECGMGLHVAPKSLLDVHTVTTDTPRGIVVQKSVDTTSAQVDILHRMEKLAHHLPGSNMILSFQFVEKLDSEPKDLIPLGWHTFEKPAERVQLLIIKSDLVTAEQLEEFKKQYFEGV